LTHPWRYLAMNHPGSFEVRIMALNACPFCEHGNQPTAKYCSECGGCLHLLPCPNCGSVSDVSVSTCPQCKFVIPGRQTTAPEPMLLSAQVTKIAEPIFAATQIAVAEPQGKNALTVPSPVLTASKPAATRNNRALIGLAVMAGVAALGYYGYQHRSMILSPSAGSVAQDRAGPGSSGVIRPESTATIPAKADSAPITAPAATTAVAAPAVAQEAMAAPAPAAPIANPPVANAAGGGERSGASDKCTDAALALGLCAPTPALPPVTHTERKQ
jgi:hypothetical protein